MSMLTLGSGDSYIPPLCDGCVRLTHLSCVLSLAWLYVRVSGWGSFDGCRGRARTICWALSCGCMTRAQLLMQVDGNDRRTGASALTLHAPKTRRLMACRCKGSNRPFTGQQALRPQEQCQEETPPLPQAQRVGSYSMILSPHSWTDC